MLRNVHFVPILDIICLKWTFCAYVRVHTQSSNILVSRNEKGVLGFAFLLNNKVFVSQPAELVLGLVNALLDHPVGECQSIALEEPHDTSGTLESDQMLGFHEWKSQVDDSHSSSSCIPRLPP